MDRTYGHLADCVLQSNPKLSDEHSSNAADSTPSDGNSTSNPKQTYANVDLNGSKVIRLVRAKQATKRKSSLDTLIEVVQKELLRVNGQSTCSSSPCSSPPPATSNSTSQILSTNSSTSCQRPKRIPSPIDDDHHQVESNETIEEIVRDTVDKLVAITLLNNAPFFVNMLTSPPDASKGLTNGNTSTTKSSSSSHPPATSDLALLSSAASDIRNSMQQSSPSKTSVPSTVLMTPRLVNFQTVLPKTTTNIQIGNTKIILVSPPTSSLPVKLVKFTPSTPMAKNVQIVLPQNSTDQIPPASQEVTVSSSPPLTIGKARRRSSTSTPIEKPVGKILRPIAKVLPVYSPSNTDEILPSMNKIHLTTTSTTSSAVQRPTNNHGPMIYRMTSVNPSATKNFAISDVPVFRVRTSETKPLINGTTTNGPVSVLACFKTTKKRNKERAIMPRPTSETVETPSTSNIRLIPSTPMTNLKISRPLMEDKGIQCINDGESTMNSHSSDLKTSIKRDLNEFDDDDDDDSWTVSADTLLRNVLSQYCFRFLDMNCQQNLSSRFDTIQANLVSGMIPNHEQFYESVMEIKDNLHANGLSKMSADNLEKLFHFFQIEYPKICQGKTLCRTNERKRTRRQ